MSRKNSRPPTKGRPPSSTGSKCYLAQGAWHFSWLPSTGAALGRRPLEATGGGHRTHLPPGAVARISKFMGAWHPEGSAPGGAWHIWLRLGPQHRPPRRTCQAPSPHRATPSTPCWPCPHAERPACREQLLKSYFPDIKSLSGFSPNKHNAEPEKGVK